MFEKIEFITTETTFRLTSNRLSEKDLSNPKYDRENLMNSKFSILGSVESFRTPPITDFAKKHLYYLQNFNIFHYKFGSYTERKNFHSFLILYTYDGSGELTYRGKTYQLDRGDGFFIDCMDLHKYTVTNKHWDTAILHLNGPLLKSLHESFLNTSTPMFHEPLNGNFQQHLERLLYIYSYPQAHRDWRASACINGMLVELLTNSTESNVKNHDLPRNIQYLIRYMEKNYTAQLTLDYLADFANINKYYLSKEFKKYTGFSPGDYLISLRISHAKTLLKSTTLPATKIAHEVGIHDINNFNNHFKKRTGMTPIQYRHSDLLF